MISIRSYLPPTVIEVNSGTYVVSGSQWIPAPKGTTLKEVNWISTRPKKEAPMIITTSRWSVVGSNGANYEVRFEHGMWNCSCVGFGFRRKCKHIDQIKSKI